MNAFLRFPLPARYAAGVLAALSVSLAFFVLVMQPPLGELGLMTQFLGVTALLSSAATFAAYRLGWLSYAPTLRWTLLAGHILSSVLTFINVWLTARLMFADQHDLTLAGILLVFAGGMAMALGYFLASAVTERIRSVESAARRLSSGDLTARVAVAGRDEVAALAATFNQMATDLQGAAKRQKALERLRADLIAWVGHDLQTPLASLRAVVEALADEVVDDPQTMQRYLASAKRDVRALSMLIDDLFELAQMDAGGLRLSLASNSLGDLVSDTLESFSHAAERQAVTLEGGVAPDVDPVRMDAPRIGRVLSNLVSNALRHTRTGGRVGVFAQRVDDRIEVSVSDNGEGIAPEDLPHVFERFYRGDKARSRATGGSGLGLAIARGIVQAHGGEIAMESQPGAGTVVRFTLP